VDAHLLIDAVSEIYSSQDMRKACPCALSLSKLLEMPGLTLEGYDTCRVVDTSDVEGVTLFTTSWLLVMAINLFNVLFIARVASACSLNLFSIC
jgi:hypothetical protein